MSRPRHYAKQDEAKRQVPETDDDDSEQFDWMDAEAEDDDPDEQGVPE